MQVIRMVVSDLVTLESSANIASVALVTTLGMSLTNSKNSMSPNCDPCETPDPTSVHLEDIPFIATL